MDGSKQVQFRNYSESDGFFYDDTVEAFIWNNDCVLTEGYWVVDQSYAIGDKTGQDPEESHQIVVSGNAKLILEDGCTLGMSYDNSFKMDWNEISQSVTDTLNSIVSTVQDAVKVYGGDASAVDQLVQDAVGILQGVIDIATKLVEENAGTNVAMISVCTGASLTVYGQEGGTGKLDIDGTETGSLQYGGGAAIGGDNKAENGPITINGGVVVAESKSGSAAIGGGYKGTGKDITINGGDVSAYGYKYQGAGIGGGYDANASNITINSGHVYAKGGYYAAGIGGGSFGVLSNFTVNGGKVTAKGGDYSGAGIGGGYSAYDKRVSGITLNNGCIYAYGTDKGSKSAGIGSGASGSTYVSDIYVNGGWLYAGEDGWSGLNGSAIGRGADGIHMGSRSSNFQFRGVDLWIEGEGQGYQSTSSSKDWWESLRKKDSVESHHDPHQTVTTELEGDLTASGYYSDTIKGGLFTVSAGYTLANSGNVTMSKLNNNGDYIYGGAVYADGGSVELYTVQITDNKSISNGVQGNGAAIGGAIYVKGEEGHTTLTYCTFKNNMVTGSTGDFRGGALTSEQKTLTVGGSVFESNKATGEGGGIWSSSHKALYVNTRFKKNFAELGGGLYVIGDGYTQGTEDADVQTVNDSTFYNNVAGTAGGGIYAAAGSTVIVKYSNFDSNQAHTYNYSLDSTIEDMGDHQGGAIYAASDKNAGRGAVMTISATDFTNNYAKQGGAVYVTSLANVEINNADITKNSAAEEGGAIYVEEGGILTLSEVYFSANKSSLEKDGEELTKYCAVYNKGQINFTGRVTQDIFYQDMIYNDHGQLNWDLTGSTANGYVDDLTLLVNNEGNLCITVNANDIGGFSSYVLGKNAETWSGVQFVLKGVGTEQVYIKVNSDAVEYNGKMYTLAVDESSNLNLTVSDKPETPARTEHIVVSKTLYTKGELVFAGKLENLDYTVDKGGAVYVEDGGNFLAHDATFTNNKATYGGSIFVTSGCKTSLTDVTFTNNVSEGDRSGAIYIDGGAAAVLYGSVTLTSASDTILNHGELVWNVGLTTQGYISDYSRITNEEGSCVIEGTSDSWFGLYKLADNAKTATGEEFILRREDGTGTTITVDGDSVEYGNLRARLYVDADDRYALYLKVEKRRIIVSDGMTETLEAEYSSDMTGANPYVDPNGRGGQVIEVQKGGLLIPTDSASFTGNSAKGFGGAIWNEGTVFLVNATFDQNAAYYTDASNAGKGGAIYNKNEGTLQFGFSSFTGNSADGDGGAIAAEGTGTITIVSTTFEKNTAGNGGAISITDNNLVLQEVTFEDNSVKDPEAGAGGAISVTGSGEIDLNGGVYLNTEDDTIDLGTTGKLDFNITEDYSGYVSDYSLITGTKTLSVSIDQGLSNGVYILADNAETADGQKFTINSCAYDSQGNRYTASQKELTVNGGAWQDTTGHYLSLMINDEGQLVQQSVNRTVISKTEFPDNDGIFTISNNVDLNLTGAVFNGYGAVLNVAADGTLQNSGSLKFTGAAVTYSGGVIYSEGTVRLSNAEFVKNYCNSNNGDGTDKNGGAIYAKGTLELADCTFTENNYEKKTRSNGGAIYADSDSEVTIADTTFTRNWGQYGGAIAGKSNTTITLSNVTFDGNVGNTKGGAVYCEGALILAGDVYLKTDTDTINMAGSDTSLTWKLSQSSTGYVSDYSLLQGDQNYKINAAELVVLQDIFISYDEETGETNYKKGIADQPTSGDNYVLAGNASTATGKNFSIALPLIQYDEEGNIASVGSWVPENGITVDGDVVYDNDMKVYYSLKVDNKGTENTSDDELVLYVINHVDVNSTTSPDGYLIDQGSVFNWDGIDANEGNGCFFNVESTGSLTSDYNLSFENGKVDGGEEADYDGGAFYNAGTITLTGASFKNNTADGNGGAIYNAGTAYLKGVVFKGNTADTKGGAVYNAENAVLTIGAAVFNSNTATANPDSSAIYNAGTLNVTGKISLLSDDDKIDNSGKINWSLDQALIMTKNVDFSFDMAKVSGDGTYSLSLLEKSYVEDEFTNPQMSGMFKLAENLSDSISVTVSGLVDKVTEREVTEGETLKTYYDFTYQAAQTMTVSSGTKRVSATSADNKFFYELRRTDSNDLYFFVDTALFLNDSWGDDAADLSATFHGATISGGKTGDGTFFNDSNLAAQKAFKTDAAVIVLGTTNSNFINVSTGYTLRGTADLATNNNTWINAGTSVSNAKVTWDLSGVDVAAESTVRIDGYDKYKNVALQIQETDYYFISQKILIDKADQATGNYVIATGDLADTKRVDEEDPSSGIIDTTGKYDFTLMSYGDPDGVTLSLNDVVAYGSKYYSLSVDDNGTSKTTDDKLVLSAMGTNKTITVKVDNRSVMYDSTEKTATYTVIGENMLTLGGEDEYGRNVDTLSVTLKAEDGLALTHVGKIENITVDSDSFAVMRNGVDVTSEYTSAGYQFDISSVGSLEVTKRDVTITAASDWKVFDGTPLVNPDYKLSGSGFIEGEEPTITVTGSQTDVGSSPNVASYVISEAHKNDYLIYTVDGSLDVIIDTPITITANSVSREYDGTELRDSGYTYTEGVLLAGDQLVVTVEGSITNAGSVTNRITSYKVMRNGTEDVTHVYGADNFIIVDGILEVSKRGVTLTSASASKAYDGTALTNSEVTVSGSGFLEGDSVTWTVTGSQTEVGTSKNSFDYEWNAGSKSANYSIYTVQGDLEVMYGNPITITAGSASRAYDGTALTSSDFTFTEGVLLEGDVLTAVTEGSVTDVGTAVNTITSYKVMRGEEDVTANYYISTADGTLEVTKRNVILVSATDSKVYDGSPLQNHSVTVGGEEFAVGEGATYEVTGSQTKVGSSKNYFNYILNDNTKAENYEITMYDGELTVTPGVVITITADSGSKMYDGMALTAGYTYTDGALIAGDELVVTVDGSITDVGVATSRIVDYKVMRSGIDVTDSYSFTECVDGELEVYQRDVTFTSGTSLKKYDGTPLTDSDVSITGDGFVEGEGVTFNVTGSQTEVGNSKNTFTYTFNDNTKAGNYNITEVEGALTVVQPEVKIEVQIVIENTSYVVVPESEDQPVAVQTVDGENVAINNSSENDLSIYDHIEAEENAEISNEGEESTLTIAADIKADALEIINENAGKISTSGNIETSDFKLFNNKESSTGSAGVIEIANDIHADNNMEIDNANVTEETGIIHFGDQPTHRIGGELTINNAFGNIINGSGSASEGNETAANFEVGGNVTINNNGHINAHVRADNHRITITNTSMHTLIGSYIAEDGDIVIKAGTGAVDETLFYAANITIEADSTVVVDENSKFVFTNSWTNNGTLSVAISDDAQEESYTIVEGSATDWGNITSGNFNYSIVTTDSGVYAVRAMQTDPVINSSLMVVDENISFNNVTVMNSGILTVTKAADNVTAQSLTLDNGTVINSGKFGVKGLVSVSGTENNLSGETVVANYISFADGAELSVNKNQFDYFMAYTDFASAGKLEVSESEGNTLKTTDIEAMVKKANVNSVAFYQDLVSVNKLNIKDTNETEISFFDAYGTDKNDTIRFYNGTNVTFGSEDHVIDLAAGSNTFQLDKDAVGNILSDLANVSTVKSASGSSVTMNDISFAAGRSASLKADGTFFQTGNITGSDQKTAIKAGKGTHFSAGDIVLNGASDSFSASNDAVVFLSNVSGVENISLGKCSRTQIKNIDGVKKLSLSNGSQSTSESLQTGNITGAAGTADSFSFGNGNTVRLGSITTFDQNDQIKIGSASNFTAQELVLNSGNDTLKIGSDSKFIVSSLDFGEGNDKFDIGSRSFASISGNISGVQKLSVGSGSGLNAAAVTGTAANDSFSFGNYNDIDLTGIDFGLGDDTLKLGNSSDAVITGTLDFGDGNNDSMKIGNGSTLTVADLDVYSLDNLTMGKDSKLYLGVESQVFAAQVKWAKYAEQIEFKQLA